MPSGFNKFRRQWCVYWPPKEYNEQGEWVYDVACELRCRWVTDESEVSVGGNILKSVGRVYPEIEVAKGGVLFEGKLYDLLQCGADIATYLTVPFQAPGCWRIQGVKVIPDLRAKRFWYVAYL